MHWSQQFALIQPNPSFIHDKGTHHSQVPVPLPRAESEPWSSLPGPMPPCVCLPAEARLRRGREPPSPRRRPNPPCPPGRAEPTAACRLSSLAEETEEDEESNMTGIEGHGVFCKPASQVACHAGKSTTQAGFGPYLGP